VSGFDHEALIDNMRKASIALSAYRAKLELMQLPEYKQQVCVYICV